MGAARRRERPRVSTTRLLGGLLERLIPFRLDWIQVEVSARCGARCAYCPVPFPRGRCRGALMGMETFARLEPAFGAAELVFLQGWGEPLLHPRFWELARRAKAAGPKVGFTTSGVLLDRPARRELLESGIDVVAVSVAGGRAATHDRWREGSPLEAVDRNLRRLGRERGEAATGPELHVAYLLLHDNAIELEDAVTRACEWGASEFVVSQLGLVLDARLEEQSLLVRSDDWDRAREAVAAARARAASEGLRFHAWGPDQEMGTCGENVLNSCFVSAAGDVSPCVMTSPTLGGTTHWFRGLPRPLRTLAFGNVRDRRLAGIWRSDPARAFREVCFDRLWEPPDHRSPPPAPCRQCNKLFESQA